MCHWLITVARNNSQNSTKVDTSKLKTYAGGVQSQEGLQNKEKIPATRSVTSKLNLILRKRPTTWRFIKPRGEASSNKIRGVKTDHLYSVQQRQGLQGRVWWRLCTLYLHACQVRVTVDNSGLCCCVCVVFAVFGGGAVSYTHLTLPTSSEV